MWKGKVWICKLIPRRHDQAFWPVHLGEVLGLTGTLKRRLNVENRQGLRCKFSAGCLEWCWFKVQRYQTDTAECYDLNSLRLG